jgi:predicted outer membrane repeat protein
MNKLGILILSLLFNVLGMHAQVLHVPTQFSSIQSAIDASSKGDSISIAPGTYSENLVFDHGVILFSHFLHSGDTSDIATTILDGRDSGSVIYAEGLMHDRLELIGFTIQNGSGTQYKGGVFLDTLFYFGGGIHVQGAHDLVLDHIRIKDNRAAGHHSTGGGLFADSSSVWIANCEIYQNEAFGGSFLGQGAGMAFYACDLSIHNSSIHNNTGTFGYAEGAGIYAESSDVRVVDSEIRDNECPNSAAMQFTNCNVLIDNCDVTRNRGNFTTVLSVTAYQSDSFNLYIKDSRFTENQANQGGIFSFNNVQARIHRTEFLENRTAFGAGCIALTSSTIDMKDVGLHGNLSDHHALSTYGGALNIYNSSGSLTNIRMTGNGRDNTDDFSYGGALHVRSSSLLLDSLLLEDNQSKRGGAIYCGSSHILLCNSLINGNNAEIGGAIRSYGSHWRILKTTIADNIAIQGCGFVSQYDTIQMVNSILWNEDGSEIEIYPNDQENSQIDIAYSNVRGLDANMVNLAQADLTWHEGIKDVDPQFTDPENQDFSLQSSSQLIDAGTALFEHEGEIWTWIAFDEYEGIAPDIGYDESNFISGVEEHDNDLLSIYPNPASDHIWIDADERAFERVSIYDMNGRQVLTKTKAGELLDISFLPPGNYVLECKAGRKFYSAKFFKF